MPTSARASHPEPAGTPRDSNLWRHAREEQAIQSCIESGRAESCCSRFGGRFVGLLLIPLIRCAVLDQHCDGSGRAQCCQSERPQSAKAMPLRNRCVMHVASEVPHLAPSPTRHAQCLGYVAMLACPLTAAHPLCTNCVSAEHIERMDDAQLEDLITSLASSSSTSTARPLQAQANKRPREVHNFGACLCGCSDELWETEAACPWLPREI